MHKALCALYIQHALLRRYHIYIIVYKCYVVYARRQCIFAKRCCSKARLRPSFVAIRRNYLPSCGGCCGMPLQTTNNVITSLHRKQKSGAKCEHLSEQSTVPVDEPVDEPASGWVPYLGLGWVDWHRRKSTQLSPWHGMEAWALHCELG